MRQQPGALLMMSLVASACAHAPAAGPTTPAAAGDKNSQLAIDERLTSGPPEVLGAWLEYGATLAAAQADDYVAELAARTALAESWKSQRKPGARDAYLDALVAVRDAGFLREYVAVLLARPGWTIPGTELGAMNLDRFQPWAQKNLPQHEVATRVTFSVNGKTTPAVPGAGLPDSDAIDPQRVPCASSRAMIAGALRSWGDEERQLGHIPLAVSSPELWLPTLEWAVHDRRAREQGVVLVSTKVAEVVFVGGFCAVDGGALAEAEPLLRHAVALSPANPNVRGELIQTLIMLKRLDDADAELEAAIRLAGSSPCHLGMLWRKRGYILFDRGKLVDSYAAYAKSLQYDPGSDIPRKEMALIVNELRRSGGYDEKALKKYSPPPPGELRVTRCR
jgi:tetratricopeptide (TPR) repeat protein